MLVSKSSNLDFCVCEYVDADAEFLFKETWLEKKLKKIQKRNFKFKETNSLEM